MKLVPVKGGFSDKVDKLCKSKGHYAEAGWFQSQGTHPTADMTYPELAQYHARGDNGVTPRPVLDIAIRHYNKSRNPEIGKAIINFLNKPSDSNLDAIEEVMGITLRDQIKWVIGNPNVLQVTNNPTPLKDTGELYEHVGYRTKNDSTIKT